MREAVTKLLDREIERFINTHERGVFYVGDPPSNLVDVIHVDEVDLKMYPIGVTVHTSASVGVGWPMS
jgi:hypothetical protein